MTKKRKSAAKKSAPTRVVQITHDSQSRPNLPTAEMEELMGDEARPLPVFYHRQAENDPQLVWDGKDAENAAGSLRVDAMPIYVQEKISPKAIIDSLRQQTAKMRAEEPGASVNLFSDFNGLPEDARVEFYRHAQKWTNRMILGDSLLAMASLAHKEGMKGKVQCVYMDPPYGIKFSSNWQPSTKSRAVKDKDESGEPEMIAAYRDTWKKGIHSYLSYMRDRLTAARDLLTESGSIFVQISDENVHLVRSLMDEVFGRENFVSLIPFVKGSPLGTKLIDCRCDFLLFYAKNKEMIKYRQLFLAKTTGMESGYQFVEMPDGERRKMTPAELDSGVVPAKSKPFTLGGLHSTGKTPSCVYDFEFQGETIRRLAERSWGPNPTGMQTLIKANRVWRAGTKGRPSYVRYYMDFPLITLDNLWNDTWGTSSRIYVVQTAEKVIQRCMLMTTDPGDLVLDPTCGSGTTAATAEKWGRRWITIDSSRVALTLARARLMGNCYDYYLLRDSEEGAKKEAELSGKLAPKKQYAKDVRQGFVCERAPHITLRAIANNKEIDEIHSRHQAELERVRKKLNAATKRDYAEWQIPTEAAKEWSDAAKKLHSEYAELRRKRQKEIDDSISQNAEMEELVDRPYKAKNAVRVSGPFTMESLSPHRILPTDAADDSPSAADLRPRSQTENESKFLEVVRKHLFAHGVQGGLKSERLTFCGEGLEPCEPGRRIHFIGRYEEKGKMKRAAICVGPEYGTVTRSLIIGAAREAADMCDMLAVVGFAFEAHADEKMMNVGRLPVVRARINNDLHMSERLATGKHGHLFVSFGEPDIEILHCAEDGGMYRAKILGMDVFNPATGKVSSSGADDIACWMIDAEYNEQSFFARHVYFCNVGKDPYDKLKRALRAEISSDAWESLYSNVSAPFPAPAGGKIAVKVINHFGDEVMKVFAIPNGGR